MNELLDIRYSEYRQKVREFAETYVKPIAIAQDEKEEFPVDLALKMGEAGLFGITPSARTARQNCPAPTRTCFSS